MSEGIKIIPICFFGPCRVSVFHPPVVDTVSLIFVPYNVPSKSIKKVHKSYLATFKDILRY